MPSNSSNLGLQCVSLTWLGAGLADIAHHIIGCHLTHVTRVYNAFNDEARNHFQALACGVVRVRL